jgi:hypothetical protein
MVSELPGTITIQAIKTFVFAAEGNIGHSINEQTPPLLKEAALQLS